MTSTPPTSKSTKSKRRKLAAPVALDQDVLYEIRDILEEKRVKGKLLYKVDWADHPTTGERYDPTWVRASFSIPPLPDCLLFSFLCLRAPLTAVSHLSSGAGRKRNRCRSRRLGETEASTTGRRGAPPPAAAAAAAEQFQSYRRDRQPARPRSELES